MARKLLEQLDLAFVPVNSESQDVSSVTEWQQSEVPPSWLLLQWIQMGYGGISGRIHALTPENSWGGDTNIWR